MRVIVTGGAGFVGAHLSRALLSHGATVTILDDFSTGRSTAVPAGAELIFCEIAEPATWARLPVADVVFHLASPASPVAYSDTAKTLRANTDGTRLAARYCQRNESYLVFASSSEVYGLTNSIRSWREDDFCGPPAPSGRIASNMTSRAVYAYAKSLGEVAARGQGIARLFNLYGPGMVPWDGRVVPEFLSATRTGKTLWLNDGGEQVRSLCHVSDAVRALVKMAEIRHCGPLNIGRPEPVSIRELAGLFGSPTRTARGRLEDTAYRCPDISKARAALGWTPEISLAQGIADLVGQPEPW
jgi:dTDP-glucose 4,6-dehydratase